MILYLENIDSISDDLTDLILEHVSLLQNVKESISLDNKKEGLEELLKVNEETSSFKLDNNLLTSDEVAAIKKAEEDKKKADAKKIADKKKADAKKTADKKKEEERKRKAEEKRKADAKERERLKNFKTVYYDCTYRVNQGYLTYSWQYDGKNILFEGFEVRESGGSIKKLSGQDKFEIDIMGIVFTNDFKKYSLESLVSIYGIKNVKGTCY